MNVQRARGRQSEESRTTSPVRKGDIDITRGSAFREI